MAQKSLIKNGRVVDGTGSPWFRGDVAYSNGRITEVGKLDPGDFDEVVDAGGLVVSPGIIDVHSHSDFSLLVNPEADSFIRQGVTTVFNGNCGLSAAPLIEEGKKEIEEARGVRIPWLSTAEYLSVMEARGVAINSATFTGLGNLLVSAMGMDAYDRPPNEEEVETMKEVLRQAMDEGSYGLSSGLEYDPQTLIDTDAIVELCRVVAEYGGIYATHIRSRDVKVVEAAREAVEIGERSGVSVEGVHWGARYPSDGKTKHIVDLIDQARERGLDAGFNQVPWTMDEDGVGWCGCGLIEPIIIGSKYIKKGAEFTYEMLKDPEVVEYLRRDLPNRQYGPILAGRRGLLDTWDRFLVAHLEKSPEYNGMNLKQIGKRMGKDPFDALIDLLLKEGEGFDRAWGAVGITSRWDTDFSLLHPNCSVAIDAGNDSPKGPPANRRQRRRRPPGGGAWLPEVADEAVRSVRRLTDRGVETLLDPHRAVSAVQQGAASAGVLARLAAMPADPPTVFRGSLCTRKAAAWSEILPLDGIKAYSKRVGATINDVLLTAVAGALRNYVLRRGHDPDGLDIRAVVPVNLRPDHEIGELGNRFGLVFLALPIGVSDRQERLRVLKQRMDAIKRSSEAIVTYAVLNGIGMTSPAIESAAVQFFGSKATAVMTNVPGPRETLYLAGTPVRSLMFWVPQSARLGLGVSILSYDGQVRIGVASDTGLVPDPESIVAEFEAEVRLAMESRTG